MSEKVKRNAAQCTHCGKVLESVHVHDFRQHYCENGPVIGKKKKWVDLPNGSSELVTTDEDARPYFAVDGGLSYVHRAFSRPEDYIELSEYGE